MPLRSRLRRLESRLAPHDPLPYVVHRRDGEPLLDAIERTLAGRVPPPGWRCIVAPEPMTLDAWIAHYGPANEIEPIENPGIAG